MVVVLSRYAKVQFCPSKMFRTPVTPHETNLLLSEITVCLLCVGYFAGVGRPDFRKELSLYLTTFPCQCGVGSLTVTVMELHHLRRLKGKNDTINQGEVFWVLWHKQNGNKNRIKNGMMK